MAAVEGPNKERYITAITEKLDLSTQQEIAAIIKQVCGTGTVLLYIADPSTGLSKFDR